MPSTPKFRFSIDRGGTFTDIYCEIADGTETLSRVAKLLSEDPQNYDDAPREGIRRIINEYMGTNHAASELDTSLIEWIRMGTTVATNALLERKGARCALLTTRGFADLLQIGNQSRPAIFDLVIKKPEMLYEQVVEVNERVMLVGENHAAVPNGFSDSLPVVNHESGQKLRVLQQPNMHEVRAALQKLRAQGIQSIAVVLLHSYIYPQHEQMIGRAAQELGFVNVSLSHEVMPMIRAVPRGNTTCVDAYLTPILREYVRSFCAGFKDNLQGVNVTFMQSDGGLTPADQFMGCRAILSGPAGGVVGAAATAYDPETKEPVISIDIGGTSCDYSRCNGPESLEHVYETELAGVTIQAPQLDITTVAAGGGSRLFFTAGRFVVGPESAGSHPGPVCYRKNGYLAVTDANLFLGRLIPEFFPKIFGESQKEPLDYEATKVAFESLTKDINEFRRKHYHATKDMTPEEVAFGFIRVANETMCRPIRALTVSKGYDVRNHVLACFGGAGAQHACSIARILKIKKVKIHRYSGILSAYGLGMADVVKEEQEACSRLYETNEYQFFERRIQALSEKAREALRAQGFTDENIKLVPYLNLRYVGTDYSIMTDISEGAHIDSYRDEFESRYHRQYGFKIPDRPLKVDDIRVRGIGKTSSFKQESIAPQGDATPVPMAHHRTYFAHGWETVPVYDSEKLGAGAQIEGPCIITQGTSTIVVIPGAIVSVTSSGDIEISLEALLSGNTQEKISTQVDPIQLAIFGHRFMSIAEQMGRTLQRTSISTNIKERLDFSCAIFGPDGHLIANAPHLPVHLGSMSEAVTYQIQKLGHNWKEGEVLIANHPHAKGTHLPDLTVISPCYDYVDKERRVRKPVFYVASRGHHSDIGGISPGSMPPFSKRLSEEGVAILSFKLVKDNLFQYEGISKIFNDAGARNLRDNIADMKAQVAANNQGISLLNGLIAEYSLEVVQAYMKHVQDNATLAVEKMLTTVAEKRGYVLQAVDYMDDGSEIRLKITIDKSGSAVFDFTGTSEQVYGNTNAPPSITTSAILYCLRCLVTMDIPLNHGCLARIKIILPEKSLLNPDIGCAVVGGNVLTSQRVTDVVFKAFKAVAASQGCMNNFIFGNDQFGYYETICGGAGAGPTFDGASAVHTHMTNTRITGVEILEKRYPVYVHQFSIRRGSGGQGKHRGGDGVIREVEFLTKLQVGILSERRVFSPYGLFGGEPGQRGKNLLILRDGSVHNLGGRNQVDVEPGDTIQIQTPGGGGYGEYTGEPDASSEEETEEVYTYENDVEQADAGKSAMVQQMDSETTRTAQIARETTSSAQETTSSAIPAKRISRWTSTEVANWVRSIPTIQMYGDNFERNNVTGKVLLDMGVKQDFQNIGIRNLVDINRVQRQVWDLRQKHE